MRTISDSSVPGRLSAIRQILFFKKCNYPFVVVLFCNYVPVFKVQDVLWIENYFLYIVLYLFLTENSIFLFIYTKKTLSLVIFMQLTLNFSSQTLIEENYFQTLFCM